MCYFGLSRLVGENLTLTEYVVTRYYRAPEVMLNSNKYDTKIDVWSAGCSFAELLSGKYLFPGENYLALIKMVLETLGVPSEEDLEFISATNPKNYVKSFSFPGKDLGLVLGIQDEVCLDLIKKMLVFNPDKRISIEEALKHPYLGGIWTRREQHYY